MTQEETAEKKEMWEIGKAEIVKGKKESRKGNLM